MSDDRRTQPIDMRMPHEPPSFRDLLLGIATDIGALKVSVEHGHEARRVLDDKIDILSDKVDEVRLDVQRRADASASHGRDLQELQSAVFGNVARQERGIVSRVVSLEDIQARQKYTIKGAMTVASAIGSAIGAGLAAAGLFLGRGIR